MSSQLPTDQKILAPIDWKQVRRVLVVRLRSIGDTVLATPSLIALRRFLPEAAIDILLEDWVVPVLKDFEAVDNVLTVSKDSTSRLKTAWRIRRNKYDVVFNLHGGTTSTFFVRASGAKYRVGFANYQYNFLYTHRLSSAADFWQQPQTHSAEQQLALLGFVGIPVEDRPSSRLTVTNETKNSAVGKISGGANPDDKIALIHPVAAFGTKQWATENFARTAEFLVKNNFRVIAVATEKEEGILEKLKDHSSVPIETLTDLTLPEITALASESDIFVGNDSGVAHIAAAVQTPVVVIFGSSNRVHWGPWTTAPHRIVFESFPCQPCAGYFCEVFDSPRCIENVSVESVRQAIEEVLAEKGKGG